MIDNRIHAIAKRWNKVEERLKLFETHARSARTPAINELRYAGRQLVDAIAKLKRNKNADVSKHVTAAEQYVQNADHDISDAGVDFFDERINGAFKKYGQRNILPHYPKAEIMRELIAEAQDTQVKSRKEREKRDQFYETIFEKVNTLFQMYPEYKKQEPMIIYDQLLTEKKLKNSERLNWIFGIFTIIGVAVGIVGLIK